MVKGFGDVVPQNCRKTHSIFLDRVLQPKLSDIKIKTLLQAKVDTFDKSFPRVLKSWASKKFSHNERIEAEKIAATIIVFSNLLQEIQEKNNAIKLEAVIVGHEITA